MSRGPQRQLAAHIPLGVAWLALGALALELAPFQLDDAFITYRYAAHLAFDRSLSFNLGEAPVEGCSSPLWLLMLAGAATLFGKAAIPHCAFALGLLGAAVALALSRRLTARDRNAGAAAPQLMAALASGIPVLWLALIPALVRYAGTGLEHAWFLVCALGVAGACAERMTLRTGILCAVLAPWFRPEGVWVVVACIAARSAICGGDLRARLGDRATWVIVIAAGASQLALSIVRWQVFHDIVPNTYWAKPSDLSAGLHYLAELASTPWGACIAIAAVLGAWFGDRVQRSYALAAVAWLGAVVIEGGDWMSDGRLALPGLALAILAADGGSVHGSEPCAADDVSNHTPAAVSGSVRRPRAFRVLLACLLATGCCSAALRSQASIRLDRANLRSIQHEARALGQWLVAARAGSVALVDIGAIGFMSDAEIIDLIGLTDRTIARAPGPHMRKRFDLGYIFDVRRPDVLVLRLWSKPTPAMLAETETTSRSVMGGVEADLADDPRLARDYRLLFAQLPYRRSVPYYGRLVYARRSFQPAIAVPERVVYVEELELE